MRTTVFFKTRIWSVEDFQFFGANRCSGLEGKSVHFLLCGRFVVFVFFLLFGVFVFFAVWAGGVLLFLLFGRGACFFAVWARDGNSLTYQSAWLVFKGPNNKKDQTTKQKNTGSRS